MYQAYWTNIEKYLSNLQNIDTLTNDELTETIQVVDNLLESYASCLEVLNEHFNIINSK